MGFFNPTRDELDKKLMNAAMMGNLLAAKKAIRKGANVRSKKYQPLSRAAYYDHADLVKLLLDHGADPHENDDYPLRWASCYGHWKVVDVLAAHIFRMEAWRGQPPAAVEAKAIYLTDLIKNMRDAFGLVVPRAHAEKMGEILYGYGFATFHALRSEQQKAPGRPGSRITPAKPRPPKPL